MTDNPQDPQPVEQEAAPPAAEPQNTAPEPTPPSENMIPKSRFDEVNERMKKAEKALEKITKAQQDAERQKKIAAGETEDLIKELQPKAERLGTLEAWLTDQLEAELKSVPDAHRSHVDAILSAIEKPEGKLQALRAQLAILGAAPAPKPAPPNLNAAEGTKQGGGHGLTRDEILAAEGMGMSLEDYATWKVKYQERK